MSERRPLCFFPVALLLMGMGNSALASGPVSDSEWPLGLEPMFVIPADSPLNSDTVSLGKKLFFEKRLSKDGSMSCATCHDPQLGFSNGQATAEGVGGTQGTHNVPTIFNRIMGKDHFWDGRAADLEAQALGPLFSPVEMAMTPELVIERLGKDPEYEHLFHKAYGSPVTLENLARAIASFERTVMTGASRFDRFEWNGEKQALTEQEREGLALFRGKAMCSTCHVGTNFTDEKYHNLGVGLPHGKIDPGRMRVTGKVIDHGAFKTPTLRNIAHTAPYMHDGSLATLAEVIDYYDRGCEPNPNLDPEIKPLNLKASEKAALVAFLESLSGPVVYVNPNEINEMAE